ncbi:MULTISPECIES: alpha-L-fucosidase [unclassified Lentimonas]|uniref:alpha-L-fucosidase n=1 Tax=unclassified Lentimonas TaxID=2630993 RepID=UPI00138A42C3|nr:MULTISPECIES: alpha-L-fucosidase [unclassified Lentimonas]
MKTNRLLAGILVCLQAATLTLHAKELAEDPGKSDSLRTGQWYRADPASQPVKLRLNDLTTIVAARAASEGDIYAGRGMTGQHGVAGFYSADDQLTFYVDAPESDDYALSIIFASPDVQTMEFKSGASVITTPSLERTWKQAPRNWRQHVPEVLSLKKGVNQITFRLPGSTVKPSNKNKGLATHIDQGQFMLFSIELGTPAARQAQLERAQAIKGDSSWMVEGKYGLFVHFSANMYGWNRKEKRADWFQESVKMFDVQHFADQVERTGAAWVTFTATHQGFLWPAPNQAVDAVMPGRTTERDLLMEIIDELAERGIATLFYLHSGYNGVDPEPWREALGADYGAADVSRFNDNMVAILRECSLRYGKKLKGFGYIDGCLMHDYPLDPHWESWARAIKAGNPDAVIGFSSNQGPTVSPFSDLSTRDGGASLAEANPELIGPGKQFGDVDPAWWCYVDTWYPKKPMNGKWIGGPKKPTQAYVAYFKQMAKQGVPVTINMAMTADVSDDHPIFNPESMAVMEAVRKAIRGK